jgi:hypothetical protein
MTHVRQFYVDNLLGNLDATLAVANSATGGKYTLAKGPHAGRHAIQHITWYLETQTTHRFAALPAWLAKDMTVYRGDNQDPAFIEKIRKLISQQQDWPRHIMNDDGYFKVI